MTAKPEAGCGDVICDRSRVVQVLSNLIGNAIKFTPAKGQISVSCALTGPEGKDVQISVSDTGAGIAPEKIRTIFERFSQINSQDLGESLEDRPNNSLGAQLTEICLFLGTTDAQLTL